MKIILKRGALIRRTIRKTLIIGIPKVLTITYHFLQSLICNNSAMCLHYFL